MEYPNPFELTFHSGFFGILGVILIVAVALKPQLFWEILIMVCIVTAGVMSNSYTFIDEYLVTCIIIGMLLVYFIRGFRLKGTQPDNLEKIHRWLFVLMIIYLIAESLRSAVVLESWRRFRWVFYHAILGIIAYIISRKDTSTPSIRRISLVISISAVIYFCMYTLNGLLNEIVHGINRYDMSVQTMQWGTSAYTMFPLVVIIPSVVILLQDKSKVYRRTGWFTLIMSIITSLYYDSRISLIAILVIIVASIPLLGTKKIIIFSTIIFIAYGIWISIYPSQESNTLEGLFGFLTPILNPIQPSVDTDRYIYMKVAFPAISDSITSLLFGYGYHSYGVAIRPHVEKLLLIDKPDLVIGEDVAAEAFTGMVVDTGLIGMILLGGNILCVYRRITKQKSPYAIVLLSSLFLMLFWSFVSNFRDMVLAYLLIMPSGLLIKLAENQPTTVPLSVHNPR